MLRRALLQSSTRATRSAAKRSAPCFFSFNREACRPRSMAAPRANIYRHHQDLLRAVGVLSSASQIY